MGWNIEKLNVYQFMSYTKSLCCGNWWRWLGTCLVSSPLSGLQFSIKSSEYRENLLKEFQEPPGYAPCQSWCDIICLTWGIAIYYRVQFSQFGSHAQTTLLRNLVRMWTQLLRIISWRQFTCVHAGTCLCLHSAHQQIWLSLFAFAVSGNVYRWAVKNVTLQYLFRVGSKGQDNFLF